MTAPEKTTWPIICKIHPQGQLIKEKKSQAAPEGELYRRNEALTVQRVRFCLNLDNTDRFAHRKIRQVQIISYYRCEEESDIYQTSLSSSLKWQSEDMKHRCKLLDQILQRLMLGMGEQHFKFTLVSIYIHINQEPPCPTRQKWSFSGFCFLTLKIFK